MSLTLEQLIRRHPRWVVLSGAGLSAASGIPTYRDDSGQWQRSDPIQHAEFVKDPAQRRRYWARSMAGWRWVGRARPTAAHKALAGLEQQGHVAQLVTQNVDRLHQRAGHRQVIDLHGRLDRVRCLHCGDFTDRADLQSVLRTLNPDFETTLAEPQPDGDAAVVDTLVEAFRVPSCDVCAGVLMPDVVFFGGTVPRERVEAVSQAIDAADGLLAVGSSLMVWSGFRFCRQAVADGKPLVIINQGVTRADDLATLKLEADCQQMLPALLSSLADGVPAAPTVAAGVPHSS